LRSWLKVWSRSGSGKQALRASRALQPKVSTEQEMSMKEVPKVITESQITTNDMFKESYCLSFNKLVDHIAKDSANCIKPLIGMANICQTSLIQQNFLDDENGNSLG
jgi:hypothetical protein